MKDFIQRVVQGVNDMGNKAMTIMDTTSLKSQIMDLRARIECDYTTIGKQVYEATANEIKDLPDISEQVNSIREKEAKIYELTTKIMALNSTKKCNQCGAVINISARFCAECGNENPILDPIAEEDSVANTCKNCNAEVSDTTKFCENCGVATGIKE